MLPLLAVLLMPVDSWSLPVKLSAERGPALAEQVLRAYGGAEAIRRYGAQKLVGTAALSVNRDVGGPNLDVSIETQGNRIKMQFTHQGKVVALGLDEKNGWIQLGSNTFPSNDPLPRELIKQLQVLPEFLQRLSESPERAHSEGQNRIGDRTFEAISIPNMNNHPGTIALVDRTTYLVHRIYREDTKLTETGDYRSIDGIPVPFSYKVSRQSDLRVPTQSMLRFSSLGTSNDAVATPVLTPPATAVVKLPLYYRDGKIVVEGTANGATIFFALSSEPFTSIDPSLVGFPASTMQLTLGTAAATVSNPLVKVPSHEYQVRDRKPMAVLGQDFLLNFNVEVDIPRRLLTLRPNTDQLDEAPNTVSSDASLIDSDMVSGVVLNPSLRMAFDVGSPVSLLPKDSSALLPAGAPLVLNDNLMFDGKQSSVGYVRPRQMLINTVGFKKPTFAASRAKQQIQPPGRDFGILGARNLRDYSVRIDYVNNRMQFDQTSQVVAREYFLSAVDDLQSKHFQLPEHERALLYRRLMEAAKRTGNINVEMLCAVLGECLPEARVEGVNQHLVFGKDFATMDDEVRLARDRVAFGLFMAVWATNGCADLSDDARFRRLEQSERRAPEQPFILTKLAQMYFDRNEIAAAWNYVKIALRVDAGYEDALALAEALARRENDPARAQEFHAAREYYAAQ